MPMTEDTIREALKQVIDPELFVNIIDLGLVYTVTITPAAANETANAPQLAEPVAALASDGPAAGGAAGPVTPDSRLPTPDSANVLIEMTMTSPACPAGPQLISQSKQAVSKLEGVGDVEVRLVMVPPWTPDRMTEDARDQLGIF